jgi:Plasmid stabilization system protein
VKSYILSPEAEQDLHDIKSYLSEKAGIQVSRRVMTDLRKALRFVAGEPGVGHSREDLTSAPVKFWPVFSYLIVYDPNTRPIGIARILRGNRDVAAILE